MHSLYFHLPTASQSRKLQKILLVFFQSSHCDFQVCFFFFQKIYNSSMISNFFQMFLKRAQSPERTPAWPAEDMLHWLKWAWAILILTSGGIPFRWDLGHSNTLPKCQASFHREMIQEEPRDVLASQHSLVRTSGSICQGVTQLPSPFNPHPHHTLPSLFTTHSSWMVLYSQHHWEERCCANTINGAALTSAPMFIPTCRCCLELSRCLMLLCFARIDLFP